MARRRARLGRGRARRARPAGDGGAAGPAAAVVRAGPDRRRGRYPRLVQGEPARQRLRGRADRGPVPLGPRPRAAAPGRGPRPGLVAAAGRRTALPGRPGRRPRRPAGLGGPAGPVRRTPAGPDPAHRADRGPRRTRRPDRRTSWGLRPAGRREHRPGRGRPPGAAGPAAPARRLVRRARGRGHRGLPRPRGPARGAALRPGAGPVHLLRLGRRLRHPPVLRAARSRAGGAGALRVRGAAPAAGRLPGALGRCGGRRRRSAPRGEPGPAARGHRPGRVLGPALPRGPGGRGGSGAADSARWLRELLREPPL